MLDNITKSQIKFFNENHEFGNLGSNPLYNHPTQTFASDNQWELFGYPIVPGSSLYFNYLASAGKVDASGTEVGPSVAGNSLDIVNGNNRVIRARVGVAGSYVMCNSASTPETFGVTAQPNYNWVFVSAVGNLNNANNTTCTAIARIIEVSDATNQVPAMDKGFIVLNAGE